MKKSKLVMLVMGSLLFNFVFWRESAGLNLFIFEVYIISVVFILFRNTIKSPYVKIVLAGTIITSLLVLIINNQISKVMYVISLILLSGILGAPKLKNIGFIVANSFTGFFGALPDTYRSIKIPESSKLKPYFRYIKISIIPLIILFVFVLIFKGANPVFDRLTMRFFDYIFEFLSFVFGKVSFWRILFFIFGLTVCSWILYARNRREIESVENSFKDNILRKRQTNRYTKFYTQNSNLKVSSPDRGLRLSLKNEFISGVLLIISVNILLLIINIIDINWVWLNFTYNGDDNLSQFVHEGTYLLILSILLSMAIMLYYFRRNLNFYSRKKLLQILSYIWIAQNVILTISVAFRNYHYISHFGLAYKRIGLIAFLVLVIIGLITLYWKIKEKKSAMYLIKINLWAVYFVLIAMCTVDWDTRIAKYNLRNQPVEKIDVTFLLSMSDRVLPILADYPDVLKRKMNKNKKYNSRQTYQDKFNNRLIKFKNRLKRETVLSWNLADYRINKQLNKI